MKIARMGHTLTYFPFWLLIERSQRTTYHKKLKDVLADDCLLTIRTYRNYRNLCACKLLKLSDVSLSICRKLIVSLDACDILTPAIHLDILSLYALELCDG